MKITLDLVGSVKVHSSPWKSLMTSSNSFHFLALVVGLGCAI